MRIARIGTFRWLFFFRSSVWVVGFHRAPPPVTAAQFEDINRRST